MVLWMGGFVGIRYCRHRTAGSDLVMCVCVLGWGGWFWMEGRGTSMGEVIDGVADGRDANQPHSRKLALRQFVMTRLVSDRSS